MKAFDVDAVPWPEPPGPLVYHVLQGSHAYGTANEDSDHDWRGVYLLPNSVFLGLHPAKTTWEDKPKEIVTWELGHFCRLLLKGNPNIVAMLSVPDDCLVLEGPEVAGLRDMRPRLVTQALRSAYVGWVHDEMRRIDRDAHGPEGRRRGSFKRLSHVPRLIMELETALTEGVLPTRLRPDQVDLVRRVKFCEDESSFEEAYDMVAQMILDLEAVDERYGPALPEPPEEEMRAWLVAARERWG